MSHLDVVPPGEAKLWNSDPYTMKIDGERLIGRGTEDNQQGIVSSVFAARAVMKNGGPLSLPVHLLFVCDEEVGEGHGIEHLLADGGLFEKGDIFLVPDAGTADSVMIETAEKSLLWIKFTVMGKQAHAATPGSGVNAFVAGSDLVLRIDKLNREFSKRNALFSPPASTFMPTRKEENVPNINTIPGEDVFYADLRILPDYRISNVLERIQKLCREVEKKYGVTAEFSVLNSIESGPSSDKSNLVRLLTACIAEVYGVKAKARGIGGSTVAAFLRNAGFETAVWATLEGSAHKPNEYCRISNMVNDAKVMAVLMLRLQSS
jgi:succinyl-diaminopimelate desuccinylase